ncbi:hypothetical protein [Burkholderia ubonensis]|uniref:hypothetical protein n=1 Tax=Burkholderia ubonensis TaxID=101571 RepID=UPI0007579EAF|nr:hypothetical protein [Burkholderia ubonensis]KVL67380.1 hypothetical protein WJ48_14095 [Burkholderia ubonensis]KVL71433.1 hypothetical protein WJ49_20420 [Burkholderia ubonensis]KVL91322.1 hypothetical protein WJ50_11405 [Burkholderia ubonensis]KWK75568.1 hypothetical protein WM15_30450 [Burkholderia ubonensis]
MSLKKFRVYGMFTCSKYLGEFEAETAEEAADKAAESEENHVSLCHHCAREMDLDEYSASSFQTEVAD